MHEQSIIDAMIAGAKNSKYGRDPEHPNASGSLTRFFTSIANENITAFCALLGQLIQHEIDKEPSVEPQYCGNCRRASAMRKP